MLVILFLFNITVDDLHTLQYISCVSSVLLISTACLLSMHSRNIPSTDPFSQYCLPSPAIFRHD